MDKAALEFLYEEADVKVILTKEFDGLATFKHIRCMMPPVGCTKRVVLDFSGNSSVKPIELYCFLEEIAAVPHFKNVIINIEGFKCAPGPSDF